MRAAIALSCLLVAACGAERDGSSGRVGGTGSSGPVSATDADPEQSETSTGSVSEEPETILPSDFAACGAEVDDACIVGDDHCICGPRCSEYGPAGAPGRCPLGEFFTLCSHTYLCLIPCAEDSECPDPAMVCRPCPEELAETCASLGSYGVPDYNGGPMMCSYEV